MDVTRSGKMPNVWKMSPIGKIMVTSNFVGTKCLVAQWANSYRAIGYDVVNINVNDLISRNAIPSAVSISISMLSNTNLKVIKGIADGVSTACTESNIIFLPGETAQLPEILQQEFPGKTFNIVGFGIGLIHNFSSPEPIKEGDLIIGLESNGLHCNGFSLVRKTLIDRWSFVEGYKTFSVGDKFIPTGKKIEEELLRPTFSYRSMIDALKNNKIEIKGSANVTNEGITCLWKFINLHNVGFYIDNFPDIPPIFLEIQKRGNVSIGEMFRVFNMGLGFYLIASPDREDDILTLAKETDLKAYTVGRVIEQSQNINIQLKKEEIVFKKPNEWKVC